MLERLERCKGVSWGPRKGRDGVAGVPARAPTSYAVRWSCCMNGQKSSLSVVSREVYCQTCTSAVGGELPGGDRRRSQKKECRGESIESTPTHTAPFGSQPRGFGQSGSQPQCPSTGILLHQPGPTGQGVRPCPLSISPEQSCVPTVVAITSQSCWLHSFRCHPQASDLGKTLPHWGHTGCSASVSDETTFSQS